MPSPYRTTAYRYPSEGIILTLTITLVLLVIAVTATATFCTSVVFVAVIVALAYFSSRSHHKRLLRAARRVDPKQTPKLASLVGECQQVLGVGEVQAFVAPSDELNAYTFGLTSPKVLVLYSALFNVMDADELRFIIGHELGHVQLGHTRINSLVGGMAGIPSASSASALMQMAFLWWNRMCEHSADRAGLLACGKPEKAVSALVKLVAGPAAHSSWGMALAYRRIQAEDDTILGDIREALSGHPMLVRRIEKIRSYSQSTQYRRLQALLNRNLHQT
jgi:Zn-dependent protease with chaperone function